MFISLILSLVRYHYVTQRTIDDKSEILYRRLDQNQTLREINDNEFININ